MLQVENISHISRASGEVSLLHFIVNKEKQLFSYFIYMRQTRKINPDAIYDLETSTWNLEKQS